MKTALALLLLSFIVTSDGGESCPVQRSTWQSSMVISKPQPSELHAFWRHFYLKCQCPLNLKYFVTLLLQICLHHFIPMHHNNHYIKAVQIHESSEVYFRNFYPFLIDQEYSRTSIVHCYIDDYVYNSQPPCGISSSKLWFFCEGHRVPESFCGCTPAAQGFRL